MELRLYLDEDSMDQRLVRALRARGMDVETALGAKPSEMAATEYSWGALDADMVARSDEEHLAYAAVSDRVLHTFNVADFYELHGQFVEEGREHAGIVLGTQQRYTVGERMRKLLRLRAERTAEEMQNRVLFLASLEV